ERVVVVGGRRVRAGRRPALTPFRDRALAAGDLGRASLVLPHREEPRPTRRQAVPGAARTSPTPLRTQEPAPRLLVAGSARLDRFAAAARRVLEPRTDRNPRLSRARALAHRLRIRGARRLATRPIQAESRECRCRTHGWRLALHATP